MNKIEFHTSIKRRLVKSFIKVSDLMNKKAKAITDSELKQLHLEVEKEKAVQKELKSILIDLGPSLMNTETIIRELTEMEFPFVKKAS